MIKKTLMTAALAAAVLTVCGGKETRGKPAPADSAPAASVATAAPETANVKIDMAFVEGGTFRMGCTPEQGECSREEKPVHSVTQRLSHIQIRGYAGAVEDGDGR